MVSIKQMKYKNQRKTKILAEGTYKGFKYFILSLGTHPCAYIVTKYIELNEEEQIFFPVHGGITYQERYLKIPNKTLAQRSNVIGWDYAHLGDQYGTDENEYDEKHRTSEILQDVMNAINYLKNING